MVINFRLSFIFPLLIFYCSFFFSPLFASGNKDDENAKLLNNEWILCITAFDTELLPPAQRIAGDVITRILVEKLQTINYRLRVSPEYAYYEGYAWRQSINATSKSLAQKMDERSLYLYRGEADWKYKRNLKKVDAEIEKLKENLAVKEAEKPLIDTEPVFVLSQASTGSARPAVPKPGTERRFCQTQKADAILTGKIMEFHSRYYVILKLYTLYNNAWVYEDEILFSMEDISSAVDEIASSLIAVISGAPAAVIAVQTTPSEANILINRNYAGRGAVPEREIPPGKITIEVAAEGYKPASAETKLLAGEQVAFEINLGPLLYSDVIVDAPSGTGVRMYNGALYVGEAPYTLRLPIDQLVYISMENRSGLAAKAVFLTPDMPDETAAVSLELSKPPLSGQKAVNKSRGRYYWAWGISWITGVTAWVTAGVYNSQRDALPNSGDQAFLASTEAWHYVSIGTLAVFGVSLAYSIFEEVRYLYTASERATPIVKLEKSKE